jgi:hypothetical protein
MGALMQQTAILMVRWYAALVAPSPGGDQRDQRDERGDVPGWVLVTVMSAGVVAVLYGVAKDELTEMLRSALNKVQ